MDVTTQRLPRVLAIFLISLAALLLEVGYTRIVSFKLTYYYTYLVIGLALLGIGSGGVLVAISSTIRRASTERIIAVAAILGAICMGIGYLVVARMHVDTAAIWDYGSGSSFSNLFRLLTICFAVFASFIAFGVIVAVLFSRAGDGIGRMYFSDLLGAGLGAMLAIPLIVRLGPPRLTMLAALVFAVVGLLECRPRSVLFAVGTVTTVVVGIALVGQSVLPDVRVEDNKLYAPVTRYSAWGPVFRVDVVQLPGTDGSSLLLLHDGTFGSGLHQFNGDPATLAYSKDPRRLPFDTLGTPPRRELIIGSAGGNEILASLANHAPNIEAVELNPVTTSLLTNHFANYTGNLTKRPDVHLHQGDGRSYLARRSTKYDLVWYVAPDSYAATNAASSGAFVLSESYLYTKQMIKLTMQHLSDNGVMVVQFGELSFNQPNRTTRYVVTARKALSELGIKDAPNHLLVAAQITNPGALSTIIVKKTAFTPAEADRFLGGLSKVQAPIPLAAPGHQFGDNVITQLATGTDAQVSSIVAHYPKNITAVTDDAPYFWHFSRFGDVIPHIFQPLHTGDPELVIGERVLLLLLVISAFYALLFLLVPFFAVRKKWRALPAKGTSAVFFGALGLGFMFFEVTMIQRFVLFLGYPSYSLTVTLAAILVSTGLGALWSRQFADRPDVAMRTTLAALAVLTLFYEIALPHLLTGVLLTAGLAVRIGFTVVILAPLGLCLGMFMPLGLGRVGALTEFREEYVAWGWAVNGFFSVIGSVLATILSMTFGFRAVQYAAFAIYVVAVLAFLRLPRTAPAAEQDLESRDVALAMSV